MASETTQGSAVTEPVWLTPGNVGAALKDLPLKAQAALRAATHLPRGTLTITTPDRKIFKVGGRQQGPDAAIVLHNWNLPRRAFAGGTIGVAESYMDGDWDSPDVTTFLELFVINEDVGEDLAGGSNWFINAAQRLRHWFNDNTRGRSRKNISAHYDLGNAFYREWLDPTMTYSSALFDETASDLESAQTAKYRALAKNIGITAGSRVLEIGCGWGGFAEYAARELGAHVTGLTISREQFDYATQRIEQAGLSGMAQIKFQDYRDETGKYDHVASIEMFEAVGEKYWPVFFGKVKDCLNPGGSAGMQIITINDRSFDRYRKRPDFIQRYVFPGGMLPTPEKLKSLGRDFGLDLYCENIFPQDYARTLAEWRERFWGSWDRLRHLGFDGRFKKLWEFYLFYCEAGFRSEYIDVRQVFYKS